MMTFQEILESHFPREEIDHRGGHEYPSHGYHINEYEVIWEEEYPNEDEGSTRNEGESPKGREDEVDDEEESSELFEESLERYGRERSRMEERISSDTHKDQYPDDDETLLDDGRECF